MKFNKIRSIIADELELQNDVVTNDFDIRIQGNKKVIIENHTGVLIYENDLVHIKTKTQNVIIKGEKLNIKEITNSDIVVFGHIHEVQIKE